jgi:hypothetical protein
VSCLCVLGGAYHDAEKDKECYGEEDDRDLEEEKEVRVGAIIKCGAVGIHGGPEYHAPHCHGQVDDPWNHLQARLLLHFREFSRQSFLCQGSIVCSSSL